MSTTRITLAVTTVIALSVAAGGAIAARPGSHHAARSPVGSAISLAGEDDGGLLPGGHAVHASIGSAPPAAGAAAGLRALGSDSEGASDDSGSLLAGGTVHATIGTARPAPHAVARLHALAGDD